MITKQTLWLVKRTVYHLQNGMNPLPDIKEFVLLHGKIYGATDHGVWLTCSLDEFTTFAGSLR